MRGSGREIRVAGTPEDTKVIVGGRGAKESKVGGGVTNRLGEEAVERIGSSTQPLSLVAGCKGGLEKQGTHDVVRGADHAFSPAVLIRGIGARHRQLNVVGEKEGMTGGVVEFVTVVTLVTEGHGPSDARKRRVTTRANSTRDTRERHMNQTHEQHDDDERHTCEQSARHMRWRRRKARMTTCVTMSK